MLQRRGNQIGLLVLRVFYFSPEKTPTVFMRVHWQLLKLVGACLGERNNSVDTTLAHWSLFRGCSLSLASLSFSTRMGKI